MRKCFNAPASLQLLTCLSKYAPRYDESFIGIMICFAICVGVSLALRVMLARENSSRDRQYGQPELSHGLEDMTDKENKSFRYNL
jgi:hypothetical protein